MAFNPCDFCCNEGYLAMNETTWRQQVSRVLCGVYNQGGGSGGAGFSELTATRLTVNGGAVPTTATILYNNVDSVPIKAIDMFSDVDTLIELSFDAGATWKEFLATSTGKIIVPSEYGGKITTSIHYRGSTAGTSGQFNAVVFV